MALAKHLSEFPQACMRGDRASAYYSVYNAQSKQVGYYLYVLIYDTRFIPVSQIKLLTIFRVTLMNHDTHWTDAFETIKCGVNFLI